MNVDYKYCKLCDKDFDLDQEVGSLCPYCQSVLELCEDEFEEILVELEGEDEEDVAPESMIVSE